MPPTSWVAIPDGLIAAWKPVTGRLMTRLRNNVLAVPQMELRNPWGDVGGSTASASFVTVGTITLAIPDCYVGLAGTRIGLRLAGSAAPPPAPPPTVRGSGRFQLAWTAGGGGTLDSASFTFTSIDTADLEVVLATPPVAPDTLDIRVQALADWGTATVNWLGGSNPGRLWMGLEDT